MLPPFSLLSGTSPSLPFPLLALSTYPSGHSKGKPAHCCYCCLGCFCPAPTGAAGKSFTGSLSWPRTAAVVAGESLSLCLLPGWQRSCRGRGREEEPACRHCCWSPWLSPAPHIVTPCSPGQSRAPLPPVSAEDSSSKSLPVPRGITREREGGI